MNLSIWRRNCHGAVSVQICFAATFTGGRSDRAFLQAGGTSYGAAYAPARSASAVGDRWCMFRRVAIGLQLEPRLVYYRWQLFVIASCWHGQLGTLLLSPCVEFESRFAFLPPSRHESASAASARSRRRWRAFTFGLYAHRLPRAHARIHSPTVHIARQITRITGPRRPHCQHGFLVLHTLTSIPPTICSRAQPVYSRGQADGRQMESHLKRHTKAR